MWLTGNNGCHLTTTDVGAIKLCRAETGFLNSLLYNSLTAARELRYMPLVCKKYKICCDKNTAIDISSVFHPIPGRRFAVISRKYHDISVMFLLKTEQAELTSMSQIFMTMYDEYLSLHFRLHIIMKLEFCVIIVSVAALLV